MVCTKIFPGLVRGLVILIINVVSEKSDNELVEAAVWHSPALLIASNVAHHSDDVEDKGVDANEAAPEFLEASPRKIMHVTRLVQRVPAVMPCSPRPSHGLVPTISQDGGDTQKSKRFGWAEVLERVVLPGSCSPSPERAHWLCYSG